MESSKAKSKETEELQQRFKKLEKEWHAFKHSFPSKKIIQEAHKYSPKELMHNLQQESPSPTEAWKNLTTMTRTNDMAVQEILQDRGDAIQRGMLKGRRLFHCPEREVRSMSFNYSQDESSDVHDYCIRRFSYSSSSSSCPIAGDNDQDVQVVPDFVATKADVRVASFGRCCNAKTRYVVFLGGFAIILLVIAVCMNLGRSSRGDECNMILVPT